jgi:hypothetical protein
MYGLLFDVVNFTLYVYSSCWPNIAVKNMEIVRASFYMMVRSVTGNMQGFKLIPLRTLGSRRVIKGP